MPINETTAKTSIEFQYQHSSKDGQTTLSYNLQFSHTDQYGPTLTIFNEDGSVGAEVPVEMFLDTVRYLASRRVIEWPRPSSSVPTVSASQNPSMKLSTGRISMPTITEGLGEQEQQAAPDFNALVEKAIQGVADVEPVQSFARSATKNTLSLPTITEGLGGESFTEEETSPEQMAAERAAARAKAKSEPKFKPAHKKDR